MTGGNRLARLVAANTGVQIAGSLVSLALSLVFLRLATETLGIERFGELAVIVSVGGIVTIVADLGVTTTLARELAKDPSAGETLAGSLLRFRVGSAAALALSTLLLLPVLPYSSETKLGLALSLVGVFFTTLASFPKAFFQVHLRLQRQASLDVLQRVLNLSAIAVVIALDGGLVALVSLMVAGNALVCAAAYWLVRPFWRATLRFDRRRALPVIRDAVGLGVVMMVGLLHYRADAVLLSLLKPAVDVGIYAVAYRFLEQAFLLPGLLVSAIFPIIARYAHAGDARLDEVLNRSFQVLLLAGTAATLLVVTLAEPVVAIVAGPDFGASVTPARILAGALPILFVSPVFFNLLFAVNRKRALLEVGVLVLAANIALNLVLIPRYSYTGAAAATVVTETLSFAGTVALARRAVPFHLDLAFLPRALAAALAGAAAAAAGWSLSPWLAAGLGMLAFAAAAYLAGAVTRADLRTVLSRPA